MKYIHVFKITDDCLSSAKYTIFANNVLYTSNISKTSKDNYIARFKKLGYTIFNGNSPEFQKEAQNDAL